MVCAECGTFLMLPEIYPSHEALSNPMQKEGGEVCTVHYFVPSISTLAPASPHPREHPQADHNSTCSTRDMHCAK